MMRRRTFVREVLAGLSLAAVPGYGADATPRRLRFFVWNDMHLRAPHVPGRSRGYPRVEEKAEWMVACAQGQHGCDRPDLIVSAGDLIDGEIPNYRDDFDHLRRTVLDKLSQPFLPCVGNHENRQGEGAEESYAAYDECFGKGRRNYVASYSGLTFVFLDTSGGHRSADAVTAKRNDWLRQTLDGLRGTPVVLVTHVPLVSVREEAVLQKSFGFSSWKVRDGGTLAVVEAHADSVVAVFSGHLHLSGVRRVNGIGHITVTGSASYPSEFAVVDVYDDRLDVSLQSLPREYQDRRGNIHGRPRHATDYVDSEHATHEDYLRGNALERTVRIPLHTDRR